ncbi:hypothetical protein NA57DRAFT_30265 [Rhizodiscina lignyota]|uniref:Xylanolytic transcriptional activator regulatory domain-containing protein n=1 Tax=Rhizodiscina lignyota TaxID=1504668 RepID=A0A9P4IRS8_9PEZI|nr:hypothetical protein NA57DRAFT_30265 [Rhizodiscina lignyota]
MIKFVNQASNGLPEKRKQTQRACNQCRKRKRRCTHEEAADDAEIASAETSSARGSGAQKKSKSGTVDPLAERTNGFVDPSVLPAASDASSTSVLDQLNARVPSERTPSTNDHETPGRRFIGDLNPEGLLLAATSPENTSSSSAGDNIGIWMTDSRNNGIPKLHSKLSLKQPRSDGLHFSDPLIQKLLLPYLEDQCLSLAPPASDFKALSAIYFAKIHPIFPVIDTNALFDREGSEAGAILLRQAICLGASMHSSSEPHLRLGVETRLMKHEEFSQRLTAAMRMIIDLGLVANKRELIQVLALLSLFAQDADGGDLPSQFCSRAVCHVHSLGIHVAGHEASEETTQSERLFLCVWVLDRLNAAFHGRAELMHERDWTWNIATAIKHQEPCFQVFLRTISLFDQVIELYRPANGAALASWDQDFPDFEDLVIASDGARISMPLLATIELFYHAVSILSHRKKPLEEDNRSSASFSRQNLSVGRVTAIAGHEFKDQLSLLPIVPYALTLSLSVAYRELRYSKVAMYQARARRQLQENKDLLRKLGTVFWSASTRADMAEHLFREMERVAASVNTNNQPTTNIPGPEKEHPVERSTEDFNDSYKERPYLSPAHHGETHNVGSTELIPFEPPLFDNTQDFDLFSHFDPNFDLAAIDSALSGDLDLSFPNIFDGS